MTDETETEQDVEQLVAKLREATAVIHNQSMRIKALSSALARHEKPRPDFDTDLRQRNAGVWRPILETTFGGQDILPRYDEAVYIAGVRCNLDDEGIKTLITHLTVALMARGLCIRPVPAERSSRLMMSEEGWFKALVQKNEAVHEAVQNLWVARAAGRMQQIGDLTLEKLGKLLDKAGDGL